MEKIKVLNAYCGIGGNRKLWNGNIDVVAVEYDPNIAAIYKDLYPNDNVLVEDAHQFILDNFQEFDFIWASPPCQTHSILNYSGRSRGNGGKFKYPDMRLYQEIILLQNFHKGKFCIENVKSYYNPLIPPQQSGRHYFWANFKIPNLDRNSSSIVKNKKGFNLERKMNDRDIHIENWHNYKGNKQQLLNNCVEPKVGEAIFNAAINTHTYSISSQTSLFL